MHSVHVGSFFVAAFLAAVTPLLAQQGTAAISGRVTDEQGAVLPGAAVVITNEDTGVYRETTASAEGTYSVAQLVPGRYKVVATLAGFRTLERSGLILQVGTTLTTNLALAIGGLEETVTVAGTSPLVDTTSARVGGNIGTAELAELPAMNRNYFASVALLPGVQFTPSTQMGNDTIVASGQSSQGNNVSVDGGYNIDDALGATAGAQVRTPLEAIQEFQVLTSMYDAEFGRASGVIVNAVSKSGTNQFKGVMFLSAASNTLTSKDFLVKQKDLAKPTTVKRDWGGVIGGPVVKNKAHFFFSLERQIDNPTRTGVFQTRPSLDFSIVEERSSWNTLIRFDHQLSAKHTWAIRYLRESAPQFPVANVADRQTEESFQDETDVDNTAVFTLTSVFGNTRVNTLRVARTWEHWWHGNECSRSLGFEREGVQSGCLPQLDHISFRLQASTEAQGPWDSNWQLEDDYSWFVPGKMGDHEFKFGARYNFTELQRVSQINMNGTFRINTDLPFDPANARTYPERLTIRQGEFEENIHNHTFELYVQDKWSIGTRTTLSAGLRYDLELIPIDETDNPLFPEGNKDYPVDWNNIAPRIGITHTLDDEGRSVLRGGYGIFYNRTVLGAIDDALEQSKFTTSNVLAFPVNAADPGPSRGQFPTDPFLVNGPYLDRALLDQLYPLGVPLKNAGVVVFDSPDRKQPYAHQVTLGYTRQLAGSMAASADYVRMRNRDMFLSRNLNPALRANPSRTAPLVRQDAFGVLGEPYNQQVWVMENTGESKYDALNVSLEKRYANNWSARVSYSLSKATGTAFSQADRNQQQVLTDLNLDAQDGRSPVDRRHILSINGRSEIPKTKGITVSGTFRYMSGAPFTIFNSNIDADLNGELVDPSPAGTYSGIAQNALQNVENEGGRFGATGPDYVQLDMRIGWRGRLGGSRTLELFFDVFNITNRTNWDNPSGDERLAQTFLQLRSLRGGSGFPRQAVFGTRFVF